MSAVAVRIRDLKRTFTLKGVLNGIDLDIAPGEFVALLGRSGSGKSTLLRALAGIDHEAEGTGEIALPPRSAVIFQDARLLPWVRVLDNILLGQPREARSRAGGSGTGWPGAILAPRIVRGRTAAGGACPSIGARA